MKIKFINAKAIMFILISLFSFLLYKKVELQQNKTKLIIHYQKVDKLNWDLWIWTEGKEGKAHKFTKTDSFGQVAEIELDGRYNKVGFLVRIPDWSKKDVEEDRYITVKDGFAEIWLKSKDKNIYTTMEMAK